MHVYDGDTVLLENGTRVPYPGIDTSELDHERGRSDVMAEAARDVNGKMAAGMPVRLEYDREKVDSGGRRLVYLFLFLPDGGMMNAVLIRRGFTHVMSIRPNLRYRDLLVDCQRKAIG